MFFLKSSTKAQSGQTLIEILVGMGVLMIIFQAIFSLSAAIYQTLGYTRNRLTARHLATQKMEIIRNLAYSDVGTDTGIPHGIIPSIEKVNLNGLDFTIHTTIIYFDDPFDGLAPTDILPTDYKRIKIEVSWQGLYDSNAAPVIITSNLAPKGVETSVGGGTLSILVIDSLAQPLPNADVHVTNDQIVPAVDMQLQTNTDGRVIIPGAPVCASCYFVETTKQNYSTDRTYRTDEVDNPNKNLITISEGQLSETTFIIDKLADLNISTYRNRDQNFANYPNIDLRLTGTKIIGTNAAGDPVYKFDKTLTTDANGTLNLPETEWDNYLITIPSTQSLDISGSNPYQPFAIDPGENINLKLALSEHTNNSLLLSITDASGSAIASASATLKLSPNFIASASSGLEDDPDFGQVFFDNLTINTYDFTISKANYATQSGTIDVNGSTNDNIILNNL